MIPTDTMPSLDGAMVADPPPGGSGWEVVTAADTQLHPTVVRWETNHTGRSCLHLGQASPHILRRLSQIRPLIQHAVGSDLPCNAAVFLNLGDGAEAGGLALCSNKETDTLIPDSEFVGSQAYNQLRQAWATNVIPLNNRVPVAFWRGGTSGQSPTRAWQDLPRIALCRIAQQRPDLFDVGISHVTQCAADAQADLARLHLLRNFVLPATFQFFRYHIDIDGNSNAWSGLFLKLLSGSPVLKVASPGSWRQWYYDRLVPWTHFVPVLSDLSDLVEKAEWLKAHPKDAHRIGAAGQALARSMTYEAELATGVKAVADAFARRHPRPGTPESRRPLTPIAATVMDQLHGSDITAGLEPAMPLDLQGWNSAHRCFAELVTAANASVIIDVGVWKGGSTMAFAKLLREHRHTGVVIAVDTFLGSPEHWERTPALSGLIERRLGRPMLYEQFLSNVIHSDMRPYVVPMPQTATNAAVILGRLGIAADIIHIDAAHDYANVMQDISSYWPLVRPGGFLVGDDYSDSWPGVVRAANAFSQAEGLKLRVESPKWIIQKPLG